MRERVEFLASEAESVIGDLRSSDPDHASVGEFRSRFAALRGRIDEVLSARELTDLVAQDDVKRLRHARARLSGAMAWLDGLLVVERQEDVEEHLRLEAELRAAWQ